MTTKNFYDFRTALARRESSDRWSAKNQFGYLGRYQFGMALLSDLGLTRLKAGSHGISNDDFEWVPPFTEEMFLNSPELQNLAFRAHIERLRSQLRPLESGLVAATHLVGLATVKRFLETGENSGDANGVQLTEYLNEFIGFDLD